MVRLRSPQVLRFIFIFVMSVYYSLNVFAQTPQVCFGKDCVDVEIVQTPEAMAKGFSGRKRLGDHQGMLFIFDTAGTYGFWMKDMNFNLDIIWIAADGHVAEIKENFAPCSKDACPIYTPHVEASYVLEVNAGFCKKYDIKSGRKIKFNGILPS